MEYLITRGVPMRSAHETVGKLVGLCDRTNRRLAELPLRSCKRPVRRSKRGRGVSGVDNAVRVLRSYGSGGRASVEEQLGRWEKRFG